tara:strand:- start:3160 stop:4023 length:864 start_codon:yes stop_codon:yes gene_type:complete
MIFIVIPSFNEKKYIKNLLNDLSIQTFEDYKIIISDNGSTDGTIDYLKKNKEVILIQNDSKFWWTKSTNAGVKYAIKHSNKGDFILTLNCDLLIEKDYLKNIILSSKKNENALIGSLDIDIKTKKISFGGVTVNEINAKYHNINYNEKMSSLNLFQEKISDFLPGRGTLVPIEVYETIGLYDEKLPHYGSDYEFSNRAKKNNYKLIVDYKSHVFSFNSNSGLNNILNEITFFEFITSFFTKKSPSNIFYRTIFIYKCFPKRYFIIHLICDFARSLGGSLLRQLKIKK